MSVPAGLRYWTILVYKDGHAVLKPGLTMGDALVCPLFGSEAAAAGERGLFLRRMFSRAAWLHENSKPDGFEVAVFVES